MLEQPVPVAYTRDYTLDKNCRPSLPVVAGPPPRTRPPFGAHLLDSPLIGYRDGLALMPFRRFAWCCARTGCCGDAAGDMPSSSPRFPFPTDSSPYAVKSPFVICADSVGTQCAPDYGAKWSAPRWGPAKRLSGYSSWRLYRITDYVYPRYVARCR